MKMIKILQPDPPSPTLEGDQFCQKSWWQQFYFFNGSSLTLLRGGWSGHTVLWEDWDEGGLPDLEKHKSSHLLFIDRLLRLKR